MNSELFQPTLPLGEPELMRASAYQRYLDELRTASGGISTRISQLSPSLKADLLRFGDDGGASEVVEVMAACVRHGKRVTIHIQTGERVVPLTVFAQERLVHCPMAPDELLGKPMLDLKVMHVEPALLQPPGEANATLVGAEQSHYPLAPLLWELAMRGLRRELLPEITGPAVYRVAPGLEIDALPATGALTPAIQRLARQGATLKELADWPGMDRERATRLLNALYLQSGLIVSRSHPDAVRDGWF